MTEMDLFGRCSCQVVEVGRLIKSSKIQHIWKFTYMGVQHSIELFESILTSKKRIRANGVDILPKQIMRDNISVSFLLGKVIEVAIIQLGEHYELRLNNFPFSHLLEIQKNKEYFKGNMVTSYSNVAARNSSQVEKQPLLSLSRMAPKEKDSDRRLFDFKIKPSQEQKVKEKFSVSVDNNKSNTSSEEIVKVADTSSSSSNVNNLIDFSSIEDVKNKVNVNLSVPNVQISADIFSVNTQDVTQNKPVFDVNDLFDICKSNDKKMVCENVTISSIIDRSLIPKNPEPLQKESESIAQLVQSIKEIYNDNKNKNNNIYSFPSTSTDTNTCPLYPKFAEEFK